MFAAAIIFITLTSSFIYHSRRHCHLRRYVAADVDVYWRVTSALLPLSAKAFAIMQRCLALYVDGGTMLPRDGVVERA